MTTKPIEVIFRKFTKKDGGDIVALFPEIPGNYSPATCSSYEHVGQHGIASVFISDWTRPAKPEEYAALMKELQTIGYKNLKVVKRFTRKHLKARKQELATWSVQP